MGHKWASLARPFSSKPAGNDVIGIDLGITNSCVAVMEGTVRYILGKMSETTKKRSTNSSKVVWVSYDEMFCFCVFFLNFHLISGQLVFSN
ncbi:unnamed protein product [Camellia sinensis]